MNLEIPLTKKLTYEENRLKYKNNFLSSVILFLKATVGLGILMNQYYFGKSGIILSVISSLSITILTCHSIYLLLKIADIEEEKNKKKFFIDNKKKYYIDNENNENENNFNFRNNNPNNIKLENRKNDNILDNDKNVNIIRINKLKNNLDYKKIENYDQLGKIVFGIKFQYICKILCFLLNLFVIIINTLNFSKFLQFDLKKIIFIENIFFYKLITILIFLIIIYFILEPEKLKYPSYIGFIIYILALLIMWYYNFKLKKTKNININFINIKTIPFFIGNNLYSIESIGTIFTIRATMRKRSQMKKVVIFSYFIFFILICINGISFLNVF